MCNVSVRLSALVFFVVFWLKNEKDERTKRQTNRYQQQQQLYSMLSHAGRRRCRSSSLKKSRSTLTAGNEQAQWRQARYRLCVWICFFNLFNLSLAIQADPSRSISRSKSGSFNSSMVKPSRMVFFFCSAEPRQPPRGCRNSRDVTTTPYRIYVILLLT